MVLSLVQVAGCAANPGRKPLAYRGPARPSSGVVVVTSNPTPTLADLGIEKTRGDSQEACNAAAELKVRAERKLGELLAGTVEHGGDRKTDSTSTVVRLKD